MRNDHPVASSISLVHPHGRPNLTSRMKAAVVILALCVSLQAAEPLAFEEISFLLRMRESESEITRQLASRRLLRQLTPNQEVALKNQGASDALLNALRAPKLVLTDAEAGAIEARRQQLKAAVVPQTPSEEAKPILAALTKDAFQLLKVAYGQSVNLNRWGGTSTDVRFFRKGGDVVAVSGKPTFIDPFARAHDPSAYNVDPLSYYASNQIITIDPNNRLIIAGLPVLHPVYESGDASLYFASSNLDGVTIAVRMGGR
jgi:hypothetical protein